MKEDPLEIPVPWAASEPPEGGSANG
jgi:hypothetical protein